MVHFKYCRKKERARDEFDDGENILSTRMWMYDDHKTKNVEVILLRVYSMTTLSNDV